MALNLFMGAQLSWGCDVWESCSRTKTMCTWSRNVYKRAAIDPAVLTIKIFDSLHRVGWLISCYDYTWSRMIDIGFVGLTILVDGTVGTHFFRSILFVITTQYELSASRNITAATVHTIKGKISFVICQLRVWRSLKWKDLEWPFILEGHVTDSVSECTWIIKESRKNCK